MGETAHGMTSVLLIDGNHTERAYYAEGLKRCAPDYLILEAPDGQSALDLYRRSHGIDCVVLEISLPGESAFALLLDLLPNASRPNVAVVILTHLGDTALWELAKENGVYACFLKPHTSAEMLDKAIQRAVACVGQMPEEDRYRLV